jgi:methylthioribulose-1-phosphate dehydratase
MRTYKKIIKDSSFFPLSLYETIELNNICNAAKRLDRRNAIPATSSNFSIRSKENTLLITKSGLHKRNLNPSHFIRSDLQGNPLHSQSPKPSDETLLHAMIYRNLRNATAVLHCHAPELEFITLKKSEPLTHAKNEKEQTLCGFFKLHGHEILKALGLKTHLEDFYLPVVQNDQDMEKLSKQIEKNFFTHQQKLPLCAFLLENHGIYCFGNSVHQAELRLEAILHLLSFLK